jgi:hypothetical protein
MTDIEQREPVAWLSRNNDGEEFVASRVAPEICWEKIPLYTGQQLAEVEARAISAERDRCNEIVRAAWGANVSIEGLDRATTAEEEAERLRALVEEAKRVLEPFSDAATTDEEVGRCDPEDDRILIVQAHGCQLAELSADHFRAARSLRDRLGVEG